MTQVYRGLPLDWGKDVVPEKKKAPARGFHDLNSGRGGKPRLTAADVLAIRLAGDWNWPEKLVASLYRIRTEYARMIMRGYTHAHIRELK